jgi:predicted transglutaminase-like cysteine proteinase
MITISIRPYTVKKIALLVLSLVGLSSLSCFAESTYVNVNSTPYDRQMARIRPVLLSNDTAEQENVSLSLVNHWIGDLRSIPYGFSMEWKTPREVETGAAADCKGKAVALYDLMHSHGAENIRLVIGKRMFTSRKTHAWLEWTTTSGVYVLDPTINWTACRAERLGRSSYIPLYAYAGTKKFRAAGAGLIAQTGSAAGQRVASRM